MRRLSGPRFGPFVFSIGADPNQDHNVIEGAMRETERTPRVIGENILPRFSDSWDGEAPLTSRCGPYGPCLTGIEINLTGGPHEQPDLV